MSTLPSIFVGAAPSDARTLVNTGTIDYSKTKSVSIGLNYLSPYLTYSSEFQPDDVLRQDFTQFKTDGIEVIILSLYWYRLEGASRGSYSGGNSSCTYFGDRFLDEVKRTIQIANESGLKVLIAFHTLWGSDDSQWCTPEYVIDPITKSHIGLAIVRSDDMRRAFIDMFTHTVQYVAETPGIWAWDVLSEPWYWGRTPNEHDFVTDNGKTQEENFITLFQQLSNIVKTLDGRLITISFCSTNTYSGSDGLPHIQNIFAEDWGWDERIFNAVDFVSFNAYLPENIELEKAWQDFVTSNIINCTERNKQVWITEFGSRLTNETEQAHSYQETLSFFATLPISGCIAWQWTHANLPIGYADSETASPYNIFSDNEQGIGKLAYQTLVHMTW